MKGKQEFKWTVIYTDPKGRTVYENYRLKKSAVREAKRMNGRVVPYA